MNGRAGPDVNGCTAPASRGSVGPWIGDLLVTRLRLRSSCAAFLLVASPLLAQETAVAARRPTVGDLQQAIATIDREPIDRTSVAYRTNYPAARLQLRKAQLLSRARSTVRVQQYAGTFVATGLEAVKRLQAKERFLAKPGELCELAYIADNDGTAQPYYLYLPPGYEPEKKYPLVVFLHGYVPTTSILDPWTLSDEFCRVAGDNGCMLLLPYGRRNTDFQGVGEIDVLAATAEVKELYPVDPARVYISGVSMGGMGAWNMALRHPGMYAAASPMSGQTDMHVWWPVVIRGWPRDRSDLLPFRRFLVEWDNPIDLVMNARGQPMFVQHGELDHLIPVSQSRTMVQAAAALGIPIKIHEFKGQSHYIYWELPCFRNAWSWTKDFVLDASPKHVTYKTYSLEYGTAFWVSITDLVEWGVPATVDCKASDDGTALEVTTQNVRLLRIDRATAPLKKGVPIKLTVNGRTREEPAAAALAGLDIACGGTPIKPSLWPPRKRAGLCGPVEEVFDTRFMVVAGTAGDAAADKDLRDKVTRWAREWDQFADGLPRVRLDSQVTDADIKTHNLVLFGTPETNSILARLADKLPITIGDHEYTVSGKSYRGPDLGLVMCYPNPLAPDRYVAIYSGVTYGEKCGINHKHDLIPDFIVFSGRAFSFDGTNRHEVAGYFDMDWQLNGKLTWLRGE